MAPPKLVPVKVLSPDLWRDSACQQMLEAFRSLIEEGL
jgi:hypothetical protein